MWLAGISMAWKYFLQGYSDKTDNVNVAVHAMAHESFMDEAGLNTGSKQTLQNFPQ